MKKLLVIALLMVYGMSSSGMTLYIHYCCGKVETLGLAPVTDENCKGSGGTMLAKQPCCQDKTVSFSLKADQVPAKFLAPSFQVGDLTAQPLVFSLSPLVLSAKFIPEVFAPPPLTGKDIIHLYCIYRI